MGDNNSSEANARKSLLWSAERLLEEKFHPADQLDEEFAKIQKNPFGKQRRKAELEAKIKEKGMYSKRLRNYQPVSDGKFRCPRCWLMDEVIADLDVTKVGRRWYGRYADLHCWRCNRDFSV